LGCDWRLPLHQGDIRREALQPRFEIGSVERLSHNRYVRQWIEAIVVAVEDALLAVQDSHTQRNGLILGGVMARHDWRLSQMFSSA
jgi:hypothetical protein